MKWRIPALNNGSTLLSTNKPHCVPRLAPKSWAQMLLHTLEPQARADLLSLKQAVQFMQCKNSSRRHACCTASLTNITLISSQRHCVISCHHKKGKYSEIAVAGERERDRLLVNYISSSFLHILVQLVSSNIKCCCSG